MDVRLITLCQEVRTQITCIYSVLSAFEIWSTACTSDMLQQVRDELYLEVICMVEKFILLIEVFFVMDGGLGAYFFGQLQMF